MALTEESRQLIERTTANHVLFDTDIARLSPAAVRLFLGLWRVMAEREQTCITISDNKASVKGRLVLNDLPSAQQELSRAGLLVITPHDDELTSYRYVESYFDTDQD